MQDGFESSAHATSGEAPSAEPTTSTTTVGGVGGDGTATLTALPGPARLERGIAAASDWLLARQDPAGFWRAELEGDTTLESYMILLEAFFGRRGSDKSRALARVIREEVLPGGGFSQYKGGPAELSVSCLSYFALKVAGERADAPHMRRSRDVILSLGGVDRANTYTKYQLAMFGQVPWSAVPAIPPEMIFLPARAPFTVYDMSAWSRTIFVPLSILWARKPVCPLPRTCAVDELRAGATLPAPRSALDGKRIFFAVDRLLKISERVPGTGFMRRAAIERAVAWMVERLEGSDGLGAILPAMASSVLALKVLGYRDDDPLLRENLAYLDGLLLSDDAGGLRMQPCLSPVWDTVLAGYALSHAGLPADHPAMQSAASWLLSKQTRRSGDWALRAPVAPGGWYFENRNELYPDVDDTCMALMVLSRARAAGPAHAQEAAIRRGLTWMLAMQGHDGGWASFDRDNDKRWLADVPFADHNAMIDPSTADITGRVLECLSHFPGFGPGHPAVRDAVQFLRREQNTDGCWYGRWGVNYIYGTWQVLRGLAAVGEDMHAPHARRAVRWLLEHQNGDGGWGESIASYDDPTQRGVGASTPSQTAWAVMGLVAAGHADDAAVRRGVSHLLATQDAAGTWQQELWTGTGFPKVFYLNYHYYRHTFPLMALAQYRDARAAAHKP